VAANKRLFGITRDPSYWGAGGGLVFGANLGAGLASIASCGGESTDCFSFLRAEGATMRSKKVVAVERPKARSTAPASPQSRAPSRKRARDDSRAADRRAQILDVSARLFAEFGFETTSVRQIADEVNILAGSLYHHFATKEEMLHEILREPVNAAARDLAMIDVLSVDAEQKLVTTIVTFFRNQSAYWEAFSIMHNDGASLRRQSDFAYLESLRAQSFGLLKAVLQDGMATRLFRQDIDTTLMIGTIFRMMNSAVAWVREREFNKSALAAQYNLEGVIDFHLDCILRMVRSTPRIEEPIPRAACDTI
jgi:AcrR family transcriptional regulator